MSQAFDKQLDARDLNCPMPLVNARKEIGKLEPGQVLKVLATDRGSVADFQGWAKVAKIDRAIERSRGAKLIEAKQLPITETHEPEELKGPMAKLRRLRP